MFCVATEDTNPFSEDLEQVFLKRLIIRFKDRLCWLLSGVNQVQSI